MDQSKKETLSTAVIRKIGGVHQAQRFLLGEVAFTEAETRNFSVWKEVTIKSGQYTHQTLCQALREQGIKMSTWSEDTVSRLNFKQTRRTVQLVSISFRQLGIRRKTTSLISVLHQAKMNGLHLCPDETAAQLLLQHPRLLTPGQSQLVVSRPIEDSFGICNLFCLDHLSGEQCLNVNHIKLNSHLHDFQNLVFAYSH